MGDSLFHSFETFNIPKSVTVTFEEGGVARIFARVLEGPSTIDGTLAITGAGQADFFLLNPHGIIFGEEATLQNVGSFVASTAESFVFSDDRHFGVTDATVPQLTVSVPIGLQFGQQSEPIVNRSQSSFNGAVNSLSGPAGLQVNSEETLALIGGGIVFEGGNLTANSGQIVIASVGADSRVALSSTLALGYEDVSTFKEIELTQLSVIDVSGAGGSISARGRDIFASENSAFINQTSATSELGAIDLIADESIELVNALVLSSPELGSTSDSANLNISATKLLVKEGSIISGGTLGVGGEGGTLTINASESVEITGFSDFVYTLITTSTQGLGEGGNIVINTKQLTVSDGAQIQAVTYGPARGGDITVNASQSVEVNGQANVPFLGESISGIRASSGIEGLPFQPTGVGGDLFVNTDSLSVVDGAEVAVSSFGGGNAGNLDVNARSVRLDNDAQLTAAAVLSDGGNLRLQNLETLVLRRGSNVSTQAGIGAGQGDGGNILIDADFMVAGLLEDSNIVAKASRGQGGNISIKTKGLYGLVERRAIAGNGTNDIDASSDFGVSGNAAVEQLTVEAELELIDAESRPLETATLVSQRCGASGNRFVVTGRGGIPNRPDGAAASNLPLVDLGEGYREATAQLSSLGIAGGPATEPDKLGQTLFEGASLIEASGWNIDESGQIKLTALPSGPHKNVSTVAGTCSG